MAYRKVYLRVRTEGYASGWSTDADRAAFKEESCRLFQSLGWTVMGLTTYDIMYDKSMWQLMLQKKFPPLRRMRWCCAHLKEHRTAEYGRAILSLGVRKYYKCRAAKGSLQEQCLSIRITEEDLKAYVLSEIQERIAICSGKTEKISTSESIGAFQTQIHVLEQQIEKQWSAKKDAFVRWSDGLISKDEYKNICAEKQQEILRLHEEIEKLSGVTIGHRDDESYTRLSDVKELTRDMLDTLVQAVHVFDGGHVEIEWKGHTAAEEI